MKIKPWLQILLALLLAVIAGVIINKTCASEVEGVVELSPVGQGFVDNFGFLGKIFLLGLKMIIVPLIFSSIVVGIAGLGQSDGFGRLGGKTVAYYLTTTAFAVATGLLMVNLVKPGLENGEPNEKIQAAIAANGTDLAEMAVSKTGVKAGEGDVSVWGVFRGMIERMIPENIVAAFGQNGQMLALIFVSLLVAFGLLKISGSARDTLLGFFTAVNELTLLVTNWIMWFAPIGVFGLVAKTVSLTGLTAFELLGKYFFVVVGALLIHLLITLPLLLKFVGKVSPVRHFYAMRNALLTAFSTASSSATLPVTMRGLREGAGVSNRVSSFVIPLGATVNMDGTALYECVAVMFVAQVLGYDLPMTQQFLVVALALLTSIGVAGIPSASLVAIMIILNNVRIGGEPLHNTEAVIGLILAVDRILDMARTAVNVFSDSCGAVIIARTEGESVLEPAGHAEASA